MLPDAFRYLATYVMYAKILANVRHHVWRFYGNFMVILW